MVFPKNLADPGAAASAGAHLLLVAAIVVLSGVRPFASAPTQTIAIDLVKPEDVTTPELPEPPKPQPELNFPTDTLDSKDKAQPPPQQAQQPATPPPQPAPAQRSKQAAARSKTAAATTAAPAATPSQQDTPAAQAAAPQPFAPQPDISIKYGANLGFSEHAYGENFDAAATRQANVSTVDIAKFRERLKTCSKMPAQVETSDTISIVIRATFARDGSLSATPFLIEASASPKGPLLMQAAIAALQACQPYTALPADHYDQWKVLDLSFTPKDFAPG